MSGKREYGDYQTPIQFAERVCLYLKDSRHIQPSAVVEPTCGIGNFLKSSLVFEANEYYGIEINREYCKICKAEVPSEKVTIVNADLFRFRTKTLIKDPSRVLIIGNPPWATNSMLSTFGSDNLPQKVNFKELKGLEALTGASNFDICEYIILQMLNEYRDTNATISMLCKTSVARNVFKEIKRRKISFDYCDILEFDAWKVFGINAAACVLLIQLSKQGDSPDVCNLYDFDDPERIKARFGYSNGRFYSDLSGSEEEFDGKCCFEWRQGIKHDCAQIMELTLHNGVLENGRGEAVQIEQECVFPLVKSSMYKSPVLHEFTRFVIVTQKKPRDETKYIEHDLPKTWKYLSANKECFERRKSSIYRNAPPFSMFGVGEYSFARYKVGVSGFCKQPMFSLLYSDDGKPVMTDDTSYFICFDNFDMAYVAMLLLNSERVQRFLGSIAFLDAKRPYTKKVLDRIDFERIAERISAKELEDTEHELGLQSAVTAEMYDDFKLLLQRGQMRFA